MIKLFGVLVVFGFALGSCNSEQKNLAEDAQETVTEAVIDAQEVAKLESVELKQQLQDLGTMLGEKMQEVDQELTSATEDSKKELEERKKQIVEWNNKVGLQLQKLGGNVESDLESFKLASENLFKDIDAYFRDDRNEL